MLFGGSKNGGFILGNDYEIPSYSLLATWKDEDQFDPVFCKMIEKVRVLKQSGNSLHYKDEGCWSYLEPKIKDPAKEHQQIHKPTKDQRRVHKPAKESYTPKCPGSIAIPTVNKTKLYNVCYEVDVYDNSKDILYILYPRLNIVCEIIPLRRKNYKFISAFPSSVRSSATYILRISTPLSNINRTSSKNYGFMLNTLSTISGNMKRNNNVLDLKYITCVTDKFMVHYEYKIKFMKTCKKNIVTIVDKNERVLFVSNVFSVRSKLSDLEKMEFK